MTLQRLLSLTRKAVDTFNLIESGDKIAVGISGGKDSLTLLYALNGLKRFYPNSFTIEAITVDLGHPGFDLIQIKALCSELNVPYTIVQTEIAQIIFNERKEPNPCSLCAKMRKGALNDAAKKAGCNKIAYAHHKDDFVETMLMSMIYQGQFYAFPPVTWFEDKGIRVIRPLMYVEEGQVRGFIRRQEIRILKSPCPVDGTTRRAYVKDLLMKLDRETPGAKERMFHAIVTGNIYDWVDPKITDTRKN